MKEHMTTKTYYSRSSGLAISPPAMKGQFLDVDGVQKRVGETIIQFVPMGGFKDPADEKKIIQYGSYSTQHDGEIAYLEERIQKLGDVFGQEEFDRMTIPSAVQIEQKQRVIEDQNRLIAQLQADAARRATPGQPATK